MINLDPNVHEARNSRTTDFYSFLISQMSTDYSYDDMRYAYWTCVLGDQNKVDPALLKLFENDPARPRMIEIADWLRGALKNPEPIVEAFPRTLYGSAWKNERDSALEAYVNLASLPTNTQGRLWYDGIAWLSFYWEDNASEAAWVKLGHRCGDPSCEPYKGCEHCSTYRCYGCDAIRPWDDGGTDTELCDACWTARQPKAVPCDPKTLTFAINEMRRLRGYKNIDGATIDTIISTIQNLKDVRCTSTD